MLPRAGRGVGLLGGEVKNILGVSSCRGEGNEPARVGCGEAGGALQSLLCLRGVLERRLGQACTKTVPERRLTVKGVEEWRSGAVGRGRD